MLDAHRQRPDAHAGRMIDSPVIAGAISASPISPMPRALEMHAESHLEVVENKGRKGAERSVDFVKFMETGNTVDCLDVHVEFGKGSAHLGKHLGLVVDEWRR